jgi:hypothetical protein
MNIKPSWITGGDPIRTHWTNDCERFNTKDLEWRILGEWIEGDESLVISAGIQRDRRIVALRARGRIQETARKLFAEAGWCFNQGIPPEIPLLSPKKWQEKWLSFVHGDITLHSLAEELCEHCVATDNLVTYRPHAEAKVRQSAARLILAVLVAGVIGFACGWMVQPRPVQPIRSQPPITESSNPPSSAEQETPPVPTVPSNGPSNTQPSSP